MSVLFRREQTEDGYAVGSTNVHFAVGDGRSNELVAEAELVTVVGGLVTVVELFQIRVVGVKHCWIRILNRPDDAIGAGVRRNAGRSSGILEQSCRLRHRS